MAAFASQGSAATNSQPFRQRNFVVYWAAGFASSAASAQSRAGWPTVCGRCYKTQAV